MGVLVWLAVPAAATILAILWMHWATRTRGPVEIRDSLAERERFKAAFATTNAPQHRPS
jgi:heme exporter protein D